MAGENPDTYLTQPASVVYFYLERKREGNNLSKETMAWLNTMTLIGFTEKRGNAWHYRESDQGDEPNHYVGAVPVDDVLRRLFNFQVVEAPLIVAVPNGDGFDFRPIGDRKAMVASDDGAVMGVFKQGYQGHQYDEWLIANVATILDDDLGIGSAGLLRNRAQAFVSVEVPENITTPEGVVFRPNLLAATSFDGTLATTYKRVVTNVVCDNTLDAGLGEAGQTFKVKHSKYSGMKISDAREALAIVHTIADDFAAEVQALSRWAVETRHWNNLLDAVVPVPEQSKRGETVAEKKRDTLDTLYRTDARCAPWNGTAFGVLQTFNTYSHHFMGVRKGVARATRNFENVLNGKTFERDAEVLGALAKVQGRKVAEVMAATA